MYVWLPDCHVHEVHELVTSPCRVPCPSQHCILLSCVTATSFWATAPWLHPEHFRKAVQGFPCASRSAFMGIIPPGLGGMRSFLTMLDFLTPREGGLWSVLVAGDWMVPVCYSDLLAECVSSYKVSKLVPHQHSV